MRRKNIKLPVICLAVALASMTFTGCSDSASDTSKSSEISRSIENDVDKNISSDDSDASSDALTEETVKANAAYVITPKYTEEELSDDYDEKEAVTVKLTGDTAECSDAGVEVKEGTVTILSSGTYVFSGSLEDGRIVIDADKSDSGVVRLVLAGADITSSDGSAIYVKNAEETIITLKENTENTVTDGKEYSAENETEGMNAAIYSKDDLTINGKGALKVNACRNHGIQSKDDLLLISGELSVTSVGDAIVGKDSVVIKEAALVIDSQEQGIKGTGNKEEKGYIYIENAKIDINAVDDGMHSDTVIQIDGGTIDIASEDDGIHSDIKILINDGKINIKDSYEGLEACMIIMNDGDVDINASDDGINATNGLNTGMGMNGGMNGRMNENITSDDGVQNDERTENKRQGGRMKGARPDTAEGNGEMSNRQMPEMANGELPEMPGGEMSGMPDGELPEMPNRGDNPSDFGDSDEEEGSASSDNTALKVLDMVFEMNGGNLYINAGGDGLDSNGNLVMNGGTVIVDGPENNGNGAIDYENSFDMNGGQLIAAGASGMAMTPSSDSAVNSVMITFSSSYKNTKIMLKDSQGNEVIAYTPVKSFNSIVFSDKNLKNGETYTVYADGEEIDSFTISQVITTVGNGGGMQGGGFGGGGMKNGGFGREENKN